MKSDVKPDYKLKSPRLPGGDLVSAALNRQVMGLADRGGGSGLVGGRWADVCAVWIDQLIGRSARIPHLDTEESFPVARVARLDDLPRIAAAASRQKLQNPDFLIVGHRNGQSLLQAADAKFSIETARAKQVSAEVVEALMGLGPMVGSLTGDLSAEIDYVPGVFLSPDYPLTHLMLQGRQGILRATVRPSEVVMVPVKPAEFFEPLPASAVMHVLAELDDLPVSIDDSLLAGLYYFRLARATVGSWLDSVKPLLSFNDRIELDEVSLIVEAEQRARRARSAFDLVLQWDADVEAIRARRKSVDHVTGVPIVTRDLRMVIAAAVKGKEEAAPSVNQVRRRLGAWFRGELRAVVGPVPPDEPDFPMRLQELGVLSGRLAKQLPEQTQRIVLELIAERPAGGAEEASER